MIKANKKFVIGIAVAMGTIALAGLLAMNVNAQPSGFVFIDENGNGQFDTGEWNGTSIQAAVDAASPGDTIYVWDGHYYEDVIVNKTVTIIGNTTIDAMSHSYDKNTSLGYDEFGFWVEADNVNISGFYMWCMGGDESGIHLNGTQYCNISGNMISGDPSDGICIENSSHNMIYNNIIQQNGYGIWLVNASNNTIEKNNISDNTVGIYGEGGTYYLYVYGNNISHNSEGGIGCYVDNYLEINITGNTISYNNCSGDDNGTGGGIRLHGTNKSVSVINATIIGNVMVQPDSGYGSHVRVGDGGWGGGVNAKESYVTMIGNHMDGGGSGTFKIGARDYVQVVAINNDFTNNTWCTNKVGYEYNSAGDYDMVKDMEVTFIGNHFSHKNYDGYSSYGMLKILAENNITATIRNNTFENSPYGGTLRIGWVCGGVGETARNVTAIISGNTFRNNSGGAILTKALNMLDVKIYGNYVNGTACGGSRHAVEVVSNGILHADIYGNTITNFTNAGIYVEGTPNSVNIHDNPEIGDGEIGIWVACNNSTVTGNNIVNVSEWGILVENCSHVEVSQNNINGSYMYENAGIAIFGTEYNGGGEPGCYNTLANNTIWGCYAGIYLENTDNETVEGNTLFDNYYGIYIEYSVNNTISDNSVTNNSCGIYLEYSPYNDILNNYVAENYGDTGIYIDADSNHTTITGNTITRNDVGIYVYGGYSGAYENVDTQIHDNKIYGNDEYGLVYYIQGGATPYINATYNWWGSVNGPNSTGGNQYDPVHTSIFADGNGDYIYGGDVTDNIHFDPWTGITLYKGWNLITFSFINSMQSASDLMDAIPGCTVVTMWDNINQKYVSYIDGFGEDFELNNGTSYFVFLTGSVMTYIIGDVYQPTINMTLYPGYNLIGWPYPEYEPAEDIADNITHCIKIAKWNAQEQTWVAEYITALGSYNFDLLMGEGAFVFVSERTQWQVVPLPPVPP